MRDLRRLISEFLSVKDMALQDPRCAKEIFGRCLESSEKEDSKKKPIERQTALMFYELWICMGGGKTEADSVFPFADISQMVSFVFVAFLIFIFFWAFVSSDFHIYFSFKLQHT